MKTNPMKYGRLGIAICLSLFLQLAMAGAAEPLNITAFGPNRTAATPLQVSGRPWSKYVKARRTS